MENTTPSIFEQTIVLNNQSIWVKPVCDFFGLDVRNQHRTIKNDHILKKLVGKNTPDLGELDKNGRILLNKNGFLRWVQLINPNTVKAEMRDKFIEVQTLLMDYLLGSVDREEKLRVTYSRVKKLKALRSVINAHIIECQKFIDNYLEGKVTQGNLDFKKPPQLPSK